MALVDEAVDGFLSAANHRDITRQVRPILRDPADDFVLELAIESAAAYVVTYNLRHFKGIEAFGIEAIRPWDFLKVLEVAR